MAEVGCQGVDAGNYALAGGVVDFGVGEVAADEQCSTVERDADIAVGADRSYAGLLVEGDFDCGRFAAVIEFLDRCCVDAVGDISPTPAPLHPLRQ